MTNSILITDCLQNDFVGPVGRFDGLPNALHVGHDESLRLLGDNPAEGPVARMIAWAHTQPDDALKVIHVRDWHDPTDPRQRAHLEQFGHHCLKDSIGAEFVFGVRDVHSRKHIEVVESTTLSNFIDARLEQVLLPYRDRPVRLGLMGVWTEAKVTFLAYELRSRYPHFRLAVCSALTASSSRENHFVALDQLERILGVEVIPSVGEFIECLGGNTMDAPLIGFSQKHPEVHLLDETTLSDTDHKLVRYLFRGCRRVELRTLDGGFSGNVVLSARSIDLHGHEQAPHVVKIGSKALIGKERTSFERIEAVLGNSAPRVADFADLDARGAIKYRYAAMGRGDSRSFQKIYQAGATDDELKRILDAVFVDQLGRFYRAAQAERSDLLQYYDFKPQWASSVAEKVAKIVGVSPAEDSITFPNGRMLPNVATFYQKTLPDLPHVSRSHYFSHIHGDLNGANIVIDGQANVWLIDFFHAHRGHVLRDLIKLENDLLFIFAKIEGEQALIQAMRLSEQLIGMEDLSAAPPPLDALVTSFELRRAYSAVAVLRGYYPELIHTDRDPTQWLIGHIRYAVHTLGFEESTPWQKRWALYSACLAADTLTRRLSRTGPLRIDWLPQSVTRPGKLGLTIAPGRRDYGRSLDEDLKVLVRERIDAVVCLLANDEFHRYGVEDLLSRYSDIGIEVKHIPTADGRAPTHTELTNLVAWLSSQRREGKNVLIHCVGGLGRAGTVAACFLRSQGLEAEAAIAIVRKARSPRAIETEVQERFIHEFPAVRAVEN